MFQTPTYRCTLNSITPPCTLHFHDCRQRICGGFFFFFIPALPRRHHHQSSTHPLALLSHHLRPPREPRLRPLPSFVTFVIGRPLHKPLRQPLNLQKDPSKAIPLLFSGCLSPLIKVRQHGEPVEGVGLVVLLVVLGVGALFVS